MELQVALTEMLCPAPRQFACIDRNASGTPERLPLSGRRASPGIFAAAEGAHRAPAEVQKKLIERVDAAARRPSLDIEISSGERDFIGGIFVAPSIHSCLPRSSDLARRPLRNISITLLADADRAVVLVARDGKGGRAPNFENHMFELDGLPRGFIRKR